MAQLDHTEWVQESFIDQLNQNLVVIYTTAIESENKVFDSSDVIDLPRFKS